MDSFILNFSFFSKSKKFNVYQKAVISNFSNVFNISKIYSLLNFFNSKLSVITTTNSIMSIMQYYILSSKVFFNILE